MDDKELVNYFLSHEKTFGTNYKFAAFCSVYQKELGDTDFSQVSNICFAWNNYFFEPSEIKTIERTGGGYMKSVGSHDDGSCYTSLFCLLPTRHLPHCVSRDDISE